MKKVTGSKRPRLAFYQRWWRFPVVIAGIVLACMLMGRSSLWSPSADAQEGGAGPAKASSPLPIDDQLKMKIKTSFTVVGVGDLILRTPIGQMAEPGFQDLIKHLRNADVAFANQEGPITDWDLNGPAGGAPIAALVALKNMGIDIVGTANNHSVDAGQRGLLETIQLLDQNGIVHAGTGRDLQEARAPGFLSVPKGTVGLVDMYGIDPYSNPAASRESGATYQQGARAGSAGLNGLHLTPYFVVTADQMEELRKIRDSVYARRSEVFAPIPAADASEPKDRLQLFGQWYKVGTKPGDVVYEMNPGDLKEIMRSIRNGKENSDFMIASIHCHEGNYSFQTYTYDNDTPDFMVELAHKSIDSGADEFIGHGVHTIRGVEIYKGKPIFYGLNTFIYQYTSSLPQNPGGQQTDVEATMQPGGFGGERIDQPERMEALLSESRFENGHLAEVRIYPIDLGQDLKRPFSHLGIPMTPSPEMAQRVLEKLQRLSEPFGTKITIEKGVGVIRIASPEPDQGQSNEPTKDKTVAAK
jgi:Bacterial capsule synthesis protein PGA_cap